MNASGLQKIERRKWRNGLEKRLTSWKNLVNLLHCTKKACRRRVMIDSDDDGVVCNLWKEDGRGEIGEVQSINEL